MKRIIAVLVFVLMIGLLAACGSDDQGSGTASAKGENEVGPVEIKLGVGYATEENLWLIKVASDLAPNYGEKYTLDLQQFRANTDRLNAYRANQIDGGTLGQGASIMSVAQGVEMQVVANIAKESMAEGFNSTFMGLEEAGYKSAADLKGKTIGIPDFKSPSDMWVRSGVRAAGLNPDKDADYAVLPIPAMEEAVRSGKIDVGMFPQPFYDMAESSGDLASIFNSKDGVPVEEDFLNLFLNPTFIEENKEAVQALVEDLQFMTKYYLENTVEARQTLLDAEFVLAEPEIYLNLTDYHRAADVSFDREGWDFVQNLLLEEGWIEEKVDLDSLIDESFLAN
ncbi:ABC transporter substrate-binding protein [Sporosarcina pasteurii]|uniref:ABC-type taurine transport system, periplasmic component n=1 Tax=Sporosarcina pasteurii TaxID=1474 RepID=A0A380C3B8_SPOPA|nr:ABC transporter substrate-binding protein [Sporosarcina pasteurii]MDS9471629.1 ABC transporter substrate-binding protein [Sporosarcina pasteurii]SUJ11478.1 ABC-type taurine transport system, periplasmic component [Sporosarcina pasteurii]